MIDQERIAEEVKKLEIIERCVRPKSIFGDDNTNAVAAQIRVLEHYLDVDDIYDFFEYDSHILEAALQAYYWVHEEEDWDAPSLDWEPLCKKEETE